MARDPAQADRLAQALRANLRRRKVAAAGPESSAPGTVELDLPRDASPREPLENKRQT